jgi:hypothetical protein
VLKDLVKSFGGTGLVVQQNVADRLPVGDRCGQDHSTGHFLYVELDDQRSPLLPTCDRLEHIGEGKDADHAAWEDGETDVPVPNDYYIRNLDPAILELSVSPDVQVTSCWYHYDTYGTLENRPITYQQFLDVMHDDTEGTRAHLRISPWRITVQDGVITALDEQYRP